MNISITFVKYKGRVSYLCRDMSKGAGCNLCSHPTCRYSRDNVGVSQCMECPTGILVMDPASGPKWKLACNRSVLYHHLVLEHTIGPYSISFSLVSYCHAVPLGCIYTKRVSSCQVSASHLIHIILTFPQFAPTSSTLIKSVKCDNYAR